MLCRAVPAFVQMERVVAVAAPPAMESKCPKLEEYEYQINIWIDFDFSHSFASTLTHLAHPSIERT